MRGGFLRVSVGLETSDKEVQALEQVFRWAEIPVLVDEEIARFSVDSPWVMYVSAPLSWFSGRFTRVGEDAPADQLGAGLATFIGQVSEVFKAPDGSVVFTDEETAVMVALTPELPEGAYRELLEVDLPRVEGERISWDDEQGGWFTLRGERCPKR